MKKFSEGKIRTLYDVGDRKLVIETSDRISAFDTVLPTNIPFKGIVINKMSAFWFDLTQHIIPNHMISIDNADMPEEFRERNCAGRCMLVKRVQMLPVECIARGYLYGTSWKAYQETGYVSEICLREGLREAEKLDTPILTFVPSGTHQLLSLFDAIQLLDEDIDLVTKMEMASKELYAFCAKYAASRGIIIADTKFQFGIDDAGQLVLAGELLTPDSSRFWSKKLYYCGKTQTSYGKQFVVDWLSKKNWHSKEKKAPFLPEHVVDIGSDMYLDVYKMLTGRYCLNNL